MIQRMNVLSPRGRYELRSAVARAVRERVRAGASVHDEAVRYGVTAATVARWVAGLGHPSYTAAVRLAPIVGIDVSTARTVS